MAYVKLTICVVAIFIGLTHGPVHVSSHKYPQLQGKVPPIGTRLVPLPAPKPFPDERVTVLLVKDDEFDDVFGGKFGGGFDDVFSGGFDNVFGDGNKLTFNANGRFCKVSLPGCKKLTTKINLMNMMTMMTLGLGRNADTAAAPATATTAAETITVPATTATAAPTTTVTPTTAPTTTTVPQNGS